MATNSIIRIGTRDSQLALWQAKEVEQALISRGYQTQIVPVKSSGDIDLTQPLYRMGIVGVFTKTLDVAMLRGDIDIAVHSMKDVPTDLPQGITQAAVLERGVSEDVFVYNPSFAEDDDNTIIATSSLRRRAQWLNRYPNHQVIDLRGNVILRLQKLEQNPSWGGMILARAGLTRLDKLPQHHKILDWMIPPAAQGAITITAREKDIELREILSKINHQPTQITTAVERSFLKKLEGGCTAPIGASAKIDGKELFFEGILLTKDGTQSIKVEGTFPVKEHKKIGAQMANQVLDKGGNDILQSLSSNQN